MDELERLRKVLLSREEVRLAYIFGSSAEGRDRPSSDIDIAVLFAIEPDPGSLDRLVFDLETACGRRVDLVALQTAPPLLAHEIISRGKVLVHRDDEERAFFEARVTARYLDTAHLRRVQHTYLKERAEAYRAASS